MGFRWRGERTVSVCGCEREVRQRRPSAEQVVMWVVGKGWWDVMLRM